MLHCLFVGILHILQPRSRQDWREAVLCTPYLCQCTHLVDCVPGRSGAPLVCPLQYFYRVPEKFKHRSLQVHRMTDEAREECAKAQNGVLEALSRQSKAQSRHQELSNRYKAARSRGRVSTAFQALWQALKEAEAASAAETHRIAEAKQKAQKANLRWKILYGGALTLLGRISRQDAERLRKTSSKDSAAVFNESAAKSHALALTSHRCGSALGSNRGEQQSGAI